MKTTLRASTFVWAGMILGSLAAAPVSAQDDGAIVAWGNNDEGQCDVPAPNNDFVAVAGGNYHSLGLKAYYILGDLNCDYVVDFDDINPFVLAVASHTEYTAAYPHCNYYLADCNEDGFVDFDDINPFVAAISGGTPCSFYNCDIDNSGAIDFDDINPFVELLSAGATCP
jgi:type 1 fimbria pilin